MTILVDGQNADLRWNQKQKRFINSRAKYPLIMGGVGSGKTLALCRRALRLSVAFPGNRGLLARYTLGEANDTLLVSWRRAIPEGLYKIDRDNWGWVITIHAHEGVPSTILVRALDERQKYESLELGWYGLSQANEATIGRHLWDTLDSRLRWVLPTGSVPTYSGFAEANSGSQWIIDLWGPQRTHSMPGYEATEVSMYDNEQNLPPDYIKSMSEKPAWWQKWFVYPCWEPLAELDGEPVFDGYFRQELHVSTQPVEPEHGWPICRGYDLPGPMSVVWFQVTRKGQLRILYELVGRPSDAILDMKMRVLEASNTLFPGFSFLDICDPAAFTKAPTDRKSPADLLRPEIILSKGETTLTARLQSLQTWFSKLVDGKAGMQIDPRCRFLINAFQGGYCWRVVAGRVLPEPRKDDYSHIVDALGHALARVSGQFDPRMRAEMRGPRGPLIPV